jgi:hypothetical protein
MKYFYLYIVLLSFLISCQYTDISNQLSPINDTTKLWPAYDTENNLYGYIDHKGEIKIKGQYLSAATFSCGLARVQLLNNSYGYIDKQGNLIAQGFTSAEQHFENLALVTTETEFGYINQRGAWNIILPYNTIQYSASNFSPEKIALLSPFDTSSFVYINKTGKTILNVSKKQANFVDNFSESFARFRKGSYYGFINTKGEVVIQPIYSYADNFSYGFAIIKTNDFTTFINKKGEKLNCHFDNAKSFSNGLAPVCKESKWGYIDTLGHTKIQFLFDNAFHFYEGVAVARKNQKYGVINQNGEIIIPFEYDGIQNKFHNGMILAYKRTNSTFFNFYYINSKNIPIYQWEQKQNSIYLIKELFIENNP